MAMVQLECSDTGKAIDIGDVQPDAVFAAKAFSRPLLCPYCGKDHAWTSTDMGQALYALQRSPEASRVLVRRSEDGVSATAMP
jgi:hypothetical protein